MSENKGESLELIDINITKDSVGHIKSLIDMYFKEGKYGFDDAQKIIISINNMYKALDTLNKLQILALRIKQQQEQNMKQSHPHHPPTPVQPPQIDEHNQVTDLHQVDV